MESPILEDSGYEALRKCALIAEGFLSGSSPSWKAVEAKPILLNPWNSGSLTNFPYSPETHNSILGMTVWVPINPKMDRFNLGGGWSSSRLRFYTDDGRSTYYHPLYRFDKMTVSPHESNLVQIARTPSNTLRAAFA